MTDLVLRNATVVPMDGTGDAPLGTIGRADLLIERGRITALGDVHPPAGTPELDASGLVALPGFVQGHVHYCQTLFRGLADDLPLMPWLQQRIWPLEAAHDHESTAASAALSVAELLLGGTTTAQVMESVRHAEAALEVAQASGMTTILGNCLMDRAAPGTPDGFVTTAAEAMRQVEELHRACADEAGRLHYAVSPRFILSCSDALSREAATHAAQHGLRIHTHACEHPDEVALVRQETGTDYILALADQGLLTPRTTLAHCVHTTAAEREALRAAGAAVAHCPTTNLKLGSGLAPIAAYRALGIPVALGADGAPCNNRLSALTELRQAALVSAAVAGPGAWPAALVLHAATAGGAAALDLQDELGSLAVGKRGDVVLLDLDAPPLQPGGDPVSRLVYGAESSAVRHVVLGGEVVVRDGALTGIDHDAVVAAAEAQLAPLLSRAGLSR